MTGSGQIPELREDESEWRRFGEKVRELVGDV